MPKGQKGPVMVDGTYVTKSGLPCKKGGKGKGK